MNDFSGLNNLTRHANNGLQLIFSSWLLIWQPELEEMIFTVIHKISVFHPFLCHVFSDNLLRGSLRAPAQTNWRSGEIGTVGLESQVPGNEHLLAQLAVQGQLRVETISFQVQDQHPGWGRSPKKAIITSPLWVRSETANCQMFVFRCYLGSLLNLCVTVADFPLHFSHEYSISSICKKGNNEPSAQIFKLLSRLQQLYKKKKHNKTGCTWNQGWSICGPRVGQKCSVCWKLDDKTLYLSWDTISVWCIQTKKTKSSKILKICMYVSLRLVLLFHWPNWLKNYTK